MLLLCSKLRLPKQGMNNKKAIGHMSASLQKKQRFYELYQELPALLSKFVTEYVIRKDHENEGNFG